MKVVEIKTSLLKEYENNARNNDKAVDSVAESIKQFGFKVPIVIDSENVIVCGHTRKKAAEKLGLKTVPCIIADDLTPEQIKAYRLADNKTAEISEWDFSKLEQELIELKDVEIDMTLFNFVMPDFNEIEIESISGTTNLCDITFKVFPRQREMIRSLFSDFAKANGIEENKQGTALCRIIKHYCKQNGIEWDDE